MVGVKADLQGSWISTAGMISTRFLELRKRRGLMITMIVLTIGVPTLFLTTRLLLHAVAPHSYGPVGDYHTFNGITVSVLYVFAFVVAATLGCTAGSADLAEGMFRQLVVTGRSRLALYLARIPAGLASSFRWSRLHSPSSALSRVRSLRHPNGPRSVVRCELPYRVGLVFGMNVPCSRLPFGTGTRVCDLNGYPLREVEVISPRQ